MDIVTLPDLYGLVSARSDNCLSIFMPTHPVGRESRQDAVRLKNLAAQAETDLLARRVRTTLARKLVEPIMALPLDDDNWSARKKGLAIFRSEDTMESYWLAVLLEESLTIDQRFHVKPLLPSIDAYPPFYVLVLSRNHLRLLRGTWCGCVSMLPRNVPESIVEALNLQTADRGEQVHSAMRGDYGKEAAVFHGQGGHRETIKDEITEYFRSIAQAIHPVLRDSGWPLILAGVEYEVAIFRHVAAHIPICDETLDGSYDYVSDAQICEAALPVARRSYARAKSQALNALLDCAHTGRASYEVEKIVSAAHSGQVETLFVNPGAAEYGLFRPDSCRVEFTTQPRPEHDLLEEATEQTILHRGSVYAALPSELPEGCTMGAIFRY